MTPTHYRVVSTHVEDIASGAMFANGEVAAGINPKDEYDKAKIDAGVFVPVIGTPPESDAPKKNEETS